MNTPFTATLEGSGEATAPIRFWTKVQFTGTCWLWTAYRDSYGYGAFYPARRYVAAHRWAYEFCVGPIPVGLELDHLCRVRACVNPEHLEPVTHRVNILRGVSPTAIHARKTHCPQGHPYNEANTYLRPAGNRECRLCKRAAKTRENARLRLPHQGVAI